MWKYKTKGFFLKEKNAKKKEGKKIIAYIVQDLGKNIFRSLSKRNF